MLGGAAVTLLLAGCGGLHGVYNVALPGGAALGDHPYRVTAEFTDALDLVPESAVRVNDVPVGRVTGISLSPNGKLAEVRLELNGGVHLPANAVASIDQTSLLGEKYVELAPPAGTAPVGTLADGARIGDTATTQGVQLEQVFGALSLLLNGGGVGQLQQITRELNKAASGNEAQLRTFLTSADAVIGQLDKHRDSISTALDGLAALSGTLAAHDTEISTVLANFAPGLQVLADQRQQLVGMLQSLDRLSQVTISTVRASQADLVADLQQLQPILRNLAAAGSALPQSLQVLLTYPFADGALSAIKGDYLNTFITTNFRTPGGTVVGAPSWPAVPAQRQHGGQPTTIGPPPSLLPSTSSVVPGLTSSAIVTSPSTSPSGSGSGSGTPSGSGSASGPRSASSASSSGSGR